MDFPNIVISFAWGHVITFNSHIFFLKSATSTNDLLNCQKFQYSNASLSRFTILCQKHKNVEKSHTITRGSIKTVEGASNDSNCSPKFSPSIPMISEYCDRSKYICTDDKIPDIDMSGTKCNQPTFTRSMSTTETSECVKYVQSWQITRPKSLTKNKNKVWNKKGETLEQGVKYAQS